MFPNIPENIVDIGSHGLGRRLVVNWVYRRDALAAEEVMGIDVKNFFVSDFAGVPENLECRLAILGRIDRMKGEGKKEKKNEMRREFTKGEQCTTRESLFLSSQKIKIKK